MTAQERAAEWDGAILAPRRSERGADFVERAIDRGPARAVLVSGAAGVGQIRSSQEAIAMAAWSGRGSTWVVGRDEG